MQIRHPGENECSAVSLAEATVKGRHLGFSKFLGHRVYFLCSSQDLTPCTFTYTHQTLGLLHVYMHLMCAYKRPVIRVSDVCM